MWLTNLADVRVGRLCTTEVTNVDVTIDRSIRGVLEELSVAEGDGGAERAEQELQKDPSRQILFKVKDVHAW